MKITKYHIIGSLISLGLCIVTGNIIKNIIINELEYDNYTIIPFDDTPLKGAVLVENVDDQQIYGLCCNRKNPYQSYETNFLVAVDKTGDLHADIVFLEGEKIHYDDSDTTKIDTFLITANGKMRDIEEYLNDWKNITNENDDYSTIFFIDDTIAQKNYYKTPFADLNGILLLKKAGSGYDEDLVGFSGEFTDTTENITKSMIVTLREDGSTQVFINGEEDTTESYILKAGDLLERGWMPFYIFTNHLKYRKNFRRVTDPVFKFACEVEDFGQDVSYFLDNL